MAYVTDEQLFPSRRVPRNFWERTGFSPRARRVLDAALVALVLVFAAGWVYSAAEAVARGAGPAVARRIAAEPSALSRDAPPPATFLVQAALSTFVDWDAEFQGYSGEVAAVFQEPGDSLELPDSLPDDVDVEYQPSGAPADSAAPGASAPNAPGVWNVLLRVRDAVRAVPGLRVVSLVPTSDIREGRIGRYRIGAWPRETGAYAPPTGLVQITRENLDTHVSTHFVLGDFLTKGQEDVWPKYVVLSPRLLDKLELTLQELEAMGHPVEDVFVVSGFRTPYYNEYGGDTSGRGALSRHMYGDAADIAIDNDGDGRMDDLNGDGRVTVADARVLAEAAERVERKYPELVGGIGIYAPTGAHAGFVHIDTRGNRARW